jgi:hypothetical protein
MTGQFVQRALPWSYSTKPVWLSFNADTVFSVSFRGSSVHISKFYHNLLRHWFVSKPLLSPSCAEKLNPQAKTASSPSLKSTLDQAIVLVFDHTGLTGQPAGTGLYWAICFTPLLGVNLELVLTVTLASQCQVQSST